MSESSHSDNAQARYPQLAQPGRLGALVIRNRVLMASLTRNRSTGTLPNDANVQYYSQRAKTGGAGLIISEGTYVEPMGSEWPNAPCLHDEEHASAWKKVVDAVHAEGTPIVAQLMHIGRVGNNDMPQQSLSGKPICGPSAVVARDGKYRTLPNMPGNSVPVPLKNPEEILDLFENAAKMAKLAGFDGVELHGANGYLIDEFLSDVSNVRDDQWGGSVENRSRLALEVIKRLIKVYGADRVGIKLSPAGGYNDMYFSSQKATIETFEYLVRELDELKIAYVQLAQYNAFGDPKIDGVPQGFDHDVVRTYGHILKQVSVITNTDYDADRAEMEVKEGLVDAVAFGRNFISNPDYFARIQRGIPINTDLNVQAFYQIMDTNVEIGYTDYPFAT